MEIISLIIAFMALVLIIACTAMVFSIVAVRKKADRETVTGKSPDAPEVREPLSFDKVLDAYVLDGNFVINGYIASLGHSDNKNSQKKKNNGI